MLGIGELAYPPYWDWLVNTLTVRTIDSCGTSLYIACSEVWRSCRSQNYGFQVLGLLPVRLQIAFRHALVLSVGLILTVVQWCFPASNPCVSLATRTLSPEFLTLDSGHPDLFERLVLYAIARFGLANLVQLAYLIIVSFFFPSEFFYLIEILQ